MGPNFHKIPQKIWLTLLRFTGRQEKKDALAPACFKDFLIGQLA